MVTKIDSPITPLEQTKKTNDIIDDLDDKLYRSEFNGVRSNCITYIPQDIKLEISSGTITLKAGSKVYVPNGTGVFDEVTTSSDLTIQSGSGWATANYFIFYDADTQGLHQAVLPNSSSGTTEPSQKGDAVWYDTTTNIIKRYNGSGTSYDKVSLPICICTNPTGSLFESITQVFNGFGYIGSTVFALPGIKGLISNGRNDDGTLKSAELILYSVKTATTNSGTKAIILNANSLDIQAGYVEQEEKPPLNFFYWYKPSENKTYTTGDSSVSRIWGIFSCSVDCDSNGKITSFTPKKVFYTLDYNNKGTIAGWGMPSNRYIDLTLGASDSTYKAPANGWVVITKGVGITSGAYITLRGASGIESQVASNSLADWMSISLHIPVKKGDVFSVGYNLTGTTWVFRFIYAEGESNV